MPQIVCNVALDVSVIGAEQKMMAKQGDSGSRLLCVRFTDRKRPLRLEVGTVVLLNAARGEERAAFLGQVTSEGEALFVLPDFVLAEAGVVVCDVSAVMQTGDRLTTEKLEIVVEQAVYCASDFTEVVAGKDLAQEFLESQSVHELTPDFDGNGYVLRPEVNRKYAVDLSDGRYTPDGFWAPVWLEMPLPIDGSRENWVVLYCHAPVNETEGGIPLQFEGDVLFSDGMMPVITMSDFEIICTFSPVTGDWRVGVVQYGRMESEQ